MFPSSAPTCFDVNGSSEYHPTIEVNAEFAETCNEYDVAPDELFHVNVGIVLTPVALPEGDVR